MSRYTVIQGAEVGKYKVAECAEEDSAVILLIFGVEFTNPSDAQSWAAFMEQSYYNGYEEGYDLGYDDGLDAGPGFWSNQ